MTLEEYKTCILSVLVKIDKICRENGINYYLHGGTLLGAIRHKGFIPWDDDIDIMLEYEEYDKLASIIRSNDYGLRFIDISKNEDTIFPYGKICDAKTIITKEGNMRLPKGYGAFVDVFPMAYYSNNVKKRKKEIKQCFRYRRLIEHNSRLRIAKSKNVFVYCLRALAFYFSKLFNRKKLIQKLDKQLRNRKQTNWLGPMGYPFPLEYFKSGTIDMYFEGHLIMVPKSWDDFLKFQFGDYMKLPPESERIPKHFIVCKKVE